MPSAAPALAETVTEGLLDVAVAMVHTSGFASAAALAAREAARLFTPSEASRPLASLAARIAPLGWHVVLYFEAADLPGLRDAIAASPVPVVA